MADRPQYQSVRISLMPVGTVMARFAMNLILFACGIVKAEAKVYQPRRRPLSAVKDAEPSNMKLPFGGE